MATKRKTRKLMAPKRNSQGEARAPKDAVMTLMMDRPGIRKGSDRVESLDVDKIEPLPSLHLGERDFFRSASIEQLAVSQGIVPLTDLKRLSGVLADDEVEDFISAIYESRERH